MAPEKRTIDVYATDERDVESIPVFLAYARPYLEGEYIFVGERPMSAKAESVNTPGAYLMKGTPHNILSNELSWHRYPFRAKSNERV